MRHWRKLHSSVLESSRFATLSDGAACLFFILVVAQDDSGFYPWEMTKIKRLSIARPWSSDQIQTFADELVASGMASWDEGGIMLRKGADLNGKPRKGVQDLIYERVDGGDNMLSARQQPVDETPTDPPADSRPKKRSQWKPPEWYLPMADLPGYVQGDHRKHTESLELICKEAGIDPAELIRQWCDDFTSLRFEYGWRNPSTALRGRPVIICIKKIKEKTNGRESKAPRHSGTAPRSSDEIPHGYERGRIR